MNLQDILKEIPIKPEIELDGGFAYCIRCNKEINPSNIKCPICGQTQDWSWLTKYEK